MDHLPPSESIRAAIERSVARTTRQQRLIADFGAFAFASHVTADVLDEACRAVARGLNVRFAKVLAFRPQEDCLLLVAGTGWAEDEIGSARLAVDDGSPAGYAISNGKPVISNHLHAELRFRTPLLLQRHGIRSALNVPIHGVPVAYGVLEADSPETAVFLEGDVLFS